MRPNLVQPLLLLTLALAACDTGSSIGSVGKSTADVRVLNASTTSIDVLQDSKLNVGNGGIAFAGTSLCMTVDLISHGLAIRAAGGTTTKPLPSFSANERYIVMATGGATALSVTPYRNSATIGAGKGAVRLINAAGTGAASYDIYVTDPGAVLGTPGATNVAGGNASAYFDVSTTTQNIRLTANGSSFVAFDAGNITLAAGERAVVVLAAPAAGLTTLRTFVFVIPASASC